MNLEHHYALAVEWTGNRGSGTSDYKAYGRDHLVRAAGNPAIAGSSDRPFRGDPYHWNPEQLLLAALSQCHMLSYLHEAATNGVVVEAYTDEATATMQQTANGGGHFTIATLRPHVTISSGDLALAESLHAAASEKCFIAASVNFPVLHESTTVFHTQ